MEGLRQLARLYADRHRPVFVAMIALLISLAIFLYERHWGFGLADESYFWYGTQRLLQGQMPLRDFMSYDIGRYLMAAAWLRLNGNDSILALRGLLGFVSVSGVVMATLLVARSWGWRLRFALPLIAWAMLFALWMGPRHKVFDVTASIALVAGIRWVLTNPRDLRWFGLGVLVGLLAVLGRNHGVYAAVASILCFGILLRHGGLSRPGRVLASLLAGAIMGYAPVWIGMLVMPGFAAAMWLSVRLMIEQGSTNLTLPVPWPWKAMISGHFDIGNFIAGCFFIGLLLFDIVGLGRLWLRRIDPARSALLVAAICASIPYTHFAFSRADISHLSQGIMPMLIGLLAGGSLQVGYRFRYYILPVLLLIGSAPAALRLHPRYSAMAFADHWQQVQIGPDALMLSPQDAASVATIRQLRDTRHTAGPVLYAPLWPGGYTITQQKSPLWEVYPLMPKSRRFQLAEIARLRSSGLAMAVILDVSIDGRQALRYRNSHALIFDYLQTCLKQRRADLSHPLILVFYGPDHCAQHWRPSLDAHARFAPAS